MKKQVMTDNAPKADHILSQAIESNGFVFVSGQIHSNIEGQLLTGTVAEKLSQIMLNITEILKSAELSLNDIVKASIYVTDMSQMPEFNEAYPSYFEKPYPAREAVCVKELPLGASIEISVTAQRS